MDVHTEMLELLGAWALDACEAEESAAVEAHLAGCEMCAAEARRLRSAAGWLAADQPAAPPAQLR
ncbi:MAG: zf-HC2 domain-containing protein, partial [Micromonosporaceae bacterium]|nr:zf-HC2 domain-containing protein [Micromonosporaceae bacterium]